MEQLLAIRARIGKYPAILLACVALAGGGRPASARDFQKRAADLIRAHREALPRLDAAVATTWRALQEGHHIFAGVGDAWDSEAAERAAGLTGMIRYKPELAHRGDIVWLEYDRKSFEEVLKAAQQLEHFGCDVVLFGPKMGDDAPYRLWVDSLGAPEDDEPLTLLANVLSLWEAQGELIAAASRNGRRLGVNVTYLLPESSNGSPAGTIFDKVRPPLDPLPEHALAAEYLDAIAGMLRDIDEKESESLAAAVPLLSRGLQTKKGLAYTSIGHLLQIGYSRPSKRFVPLANWADAATYLDATGKRGVLLYVGYVPEKQPFDAAKDLRKAGVSIVWSGARPADLSAFLKPGEVFIDQHWILGDCAIRDHGEPCMLPVSGVAALYVFERLRDLTGDSGR